LKNWVHPSILKLYSYKSWGSRPSHLHRIILRHSGLYQEQKSASIKKSFNHYCLTDLSVDSNDITALVSGEQKHYFHLWGLQKPLVAFATRDFFRPHSWKQCFFTLLSPHSNITLLHYSILKTFLLYRLKLEINLK
jgi:hypothetical protein